jgi:hypothetical protein
MASPARLALARRGEWIWAPLLYVLAVVWLYRDLWHQHGVATGLGWDTIDSYGPDLEFFVRELRHGRFSLWNPYDKGGYPLFCDPQIDRYYPFNWPFAAWGAVFGASWWLVQIKMLAHQVVAAAMMHLFLRTRGLPPRAAIVGGFALITTTPMLAHKASILLWPLVWVPLIWVAIDKLLARPSWRRGVALAAAVTLVATAASPPGLWYAMMLVAPYAVWRLTSAMRAGLPRVQLIAVARGAAIGAAVLGLVLALTVLPSLDLAALGSRDRFGGGTPAFAIGGGLPLGRALVGVLVRGAGLPEVYLGVIAMLVAACAMTIRPWVDRGAPVLFVTVGIAALIFAAGDRSPVLPWLVAHVPGFALWRVPGRYKLVSCWAFAACAGYGVVMLEAARGEPQLRRRLYITIAGVLTVSLVTVLVWGTPATFKERPAWWSFVAAVIASALARVAARRDATLSRIAVALIAIGVLLDAPAFDFVLPGEPPAAEPRRVHADDDAVVARMDGARDRWRVYDEFVLGERAGARLGIRDFRGYPAIDPLSIHRYVDVLDYARHHDPAIVTDFNVRWLLLRPHFRYGLDATYVRPATTTFELRGGDLWEARHPAPLVAWYPAATVVERVADALPAVRATEDPDGIRRHAVLERADAARLPPGAEAALMSAAPDTREGALEAYAPDEIRVAVDAPSAGLVVLNETEFPGWEVEVDGAPAVELRANYLSRATWVDAGHHELVWRFAPAHWRMLLAGYVLALTIMAGAGACALVARARQRRAPPGPST